MIFWQPPRRPKNLANHARHWHVARMQQFMKMTLAALALPALLLPFSAIADDTNSFGFSGKEIYPIDQQISLLHVADINGDGLNDIVVANNLRAKINILYNLTGKTNAPADPTIRPTRRRVHGGRG